jgi:hypothetical protein
MRDNIGIGDFPRRYSYPRDYTYGGDLFVIRDVLTADRDGIRFAGFCQFKTKRADGVVVWKPCPEGASFPTIEPYEGIHG